MKIGFVGVSSTGKTTLSRMTATRLGLPHVQEVLEEAFEWCERHGIPTSTRDCRMFTDQDKKNFEVGMFAAQRRMEMKAGPDYVADSAQLEQMMYLLYCCPAIMSLDQVHTLYGDGMRWSKSTYDLVFYLPFGTAAKPIIPIVDDNRRLTNPYMLQAMDGVLQSVLTDALDQGVPVFQVPVVGADKRLTYVLETIERHTNFRR